MAYRGSGLSSFISSAQSSYNKAQSLNDQMATDKFNNSFKTAADLQEYTDYLNSRIKYEQNTNPAKAFSLNKAIESANRGYTSAEITRQSIAIDEQTGSPQQKWNTIADLYQKAYANGDYNLAQQLQLKADNLSISMQQHAQAQAKAEQTLLNTMAENNATSIGNLVDQVLHGKGGWQYNGQTLPTVGDIQDTIAQKGIKALEAQTKGGGATNMFDNLKATMQMVADLYSQAASVVQSASPSEARTFQDEANKITNGETSIKVGGHDFNMNDLTTYANIVRAGGQPFYQGTNSQGQFTLHAEKITGYHIAKSTDGTYYVTEVNDPIGSQTKFSDVKNALNKMGYDIVGNQANSDGTYTVLDRKTETSHDVVVNGDGTFSFAGDFNPQTGMPNSLYKIGTDGKVSQIDPAQEYMKQQAAQQQAQHQTWAEGQLKNALGKGYTGNFATDIKELAQRATDQPDKFLELYKNITEPAGLVPGATWASKDLSSPDIVKSFGPSDFGPAGGPAVQATANPQLTAPSPQQTALAPTLQNAPAFNINQNPNPQASISVQSTAPTPAVRVAPSAPTPAVRMAPAPATPSVKVVGAPPPQQNNGGGGIIHTVGNWLSSAGNALGNIFHF